MRYLIFILFLFLTTSRCIPAYASDNNKVIVVVRTSKEELASLDKILKDTTIDGIVLYISWRTLEPEEGVFNWNILDIVRNKCLKSNKSFHLAVIAGRWVPKWIYGKGVKSISWTSNVNYVDEGVQGEATAPIPWDSQFFKLWKNLLVNLSKHLVNNKPDVVMITGPSLANGLEANFALPYKKFMTSGYNEDLYLSAWFQTIRLFNELFSDSKLALAVHDQIGPVILSKPTRTLSIANKIIAYANETISNNRFIPMLFSLTEESWFNPTNGLVKIVTKNKRFAFQLLRVHSGKNNANTTFKRALDKGFAFGPEWIEIWMRDYLDNNVWLNYVNN